jgi:hypothetical protein
VCVIVSVCVSVSVCECVYVCVCVCVFVKGCSVCKIFAARLRYYLTLVQRLRIYFPLFVWGAVWLVPRSLLFLG